MNPRLHAHLQLLRPANVATTAADILAGYLYVGGDLGNSSNALVLMASSACLYAGGVALNDVCDASRDEVHRPNRPIPSKLVSRSGAAVLATSLMIVGLALGFCASQRSGLVALCLVGSILLYDIVLKTSVFGPAVMALCRALNLMLGMSYASIHGDMQTMLPVGLMWLYVFSLTCFARQETRVTSTRQLFAAAGGVGLASLGLIGLVWAVPQDHQDHQTFIVGAIALSVVVMKYGLTTCQTGNPSDVRRAVKVFVLMIPVFDSCIGWACCGPLGACIVLAPLAVALTLARRFRVA